MSVYLDPLQIVLISQNKILQKTADNFSKPVTNGFDPHIFVNYPIVSPNEINDDCSLIVIDNNIDSPFYDNLRNSCFIKTFNNGYEYLGEKVSSEYCIMQIIPNENNQEKSILYINCNNIDLLSKNFFTRRVVIPSYANGYHEFWNNEALIFDGKNYYKVYENGMKIEKI